MEKWWGDNQPSKNEAAQRKAYCGVTLSTINLIQNSMMRTHYLCAFATACTRNYCKKMINYILGHSAVQLQLLSEIRMLLV
jgi:hypothetical protein